jgi:hypothetical protein
MHEFVPLPSQQSAIQVASGDASAIPMVALHVVGRAAIIALGMVAVGIRRPAVLVPGALGGSLAVEAFVLGHAFTNCQSSKG